MGRRFALSLILLLALSNLIMAESASAQTPTPSPVPIPKPSVPEFTIQLIGPEYVYPTTYHLDQNTGQIVADIGYTNEYSYVEVSIKNQPLVFDYSNVHLIGAFGFIIIFKLSHIHPANGLIFIMLGIMGMVFHQILNILTCLSL